MISPGARRLSDAERAFMARELKRLAALPFQELAELPEATDLSRALQFPGFSLRVYRAPAPEGGVKIVVQGSRAVRRFLMVQLSATETAGFVKSPDERLRKLGREELQDRP